MSRDKDDRAYYAQRARQERERANACQDKAVALPHLKLAEEYERRADGGPIQLKQAQSG